MSDVHKKEWVNHFIIAGGIIVGIFIIIGIFVEIQPFLGSNFTPSISKAVCSECIGIEENNTQQVIPLTSFITLELPEKLYPQRNLVLLNDPSRTFEKVGPMDPKIKGDWAIQLHAIKVGGADIIVQGIDSSIPDYHVLVVIP